MVTCRENVKESGHLAMLGGSIQKLKTPSWPPFKPITQLASTDNQHSTMEKKKEKLVLWMIMLLMLLIVGVVKADEEAPNSNNIISESPTHNPPNSYWEEVRKVLNKAYTYLFPPKIDFRPGKAVEDGGVSVNENVKEAATKSFQKTKEMVEDSAKAAAETLQKSPPHSEL